MSKYTTELRFICEFEAGFDESHGLRDLNEILTLAAPKIFNFDFPIFDELYRRPLEKKILRHFYTREICEETVALWKLRLEDKLNLIMPYFNKLYESELIQFNPLYDTDLTREHSGENEGTHTTQNTLSERNTEETNTSGSNSSTRTSSENNSGQSSKTETNSRTKTEWDLFSDTPQGGVSGLENNTYLTNARKISGTDSDTINDNGTTAEIKSGSITDSGSSSIETSANGTRNASESGSSNISNTEEYVEHVFGKNGGASYSKMIQDFRETFLNIDNMVMESLETLFFGLW